MALPVGPAITFLFTDIEGSTRLEQAVGSGAWARLVARHDELLRAAIEGAAGVVVKTEGDAFFAAFAEPSHAAVAAVRAQRALAAEPWDGVPEVRVRMGLHLGDGRLRGGRADGDPEDYVGIDVNYAARIAAAANGGQIVLSHALVTRLPAPLAIGDGMADVRLIDDGPRTVKDFDDPMPLYRLVVPGAADDERRLRTLDVPTNLPGDVTSLVGRDDEMALVREELAASRIVTLTGPGGSGKTRLALAVARGQRSAFPHGVWFVDLAAVTDPSRIEAAIAVAIGVRESVEQTTSEALAARLRDATALLLLDNLEQLLPEGAQVVARLVREAPALRVLVTSRELLRISGEVGHPVPPLGIDAGVELFLARAHSHRPDFVASGDTLAAVRAICLRLDGLPLAIELAAARTRVLSPAAILERLGRSLDLGGGARDMPERQRTLRGAVAWSYELLDERERELFERLGAFASGWTAEAAYAVADADGGLGLDVADGLESLADKSLIRTAPTDEGTRFSLHPLLREYALERLEARGLRAATEALFAAVVADEAQAAGDTIFAHGADAALVKLDVEDGNVHAAVAWAIENREPDLGLRILGSVWRWLQQRGRIREPRALLARLLALPSGDPRLRIVGLAAEGGLAYWMRDFDAATSAYEERLALAIGTGDDLLLADAHYDLGFIGMVRKDEAMLRAHEERALALYTALGHEEGMVRARQAIVLAVFLGGDYLLAQALEAENLAAFRRRDSPLQVADSLTLMSAMEWRRGDRAAAWACAAEALAMFTAVGSMPGMSRGLVMAAIIQLSDGDPELGTRLAGAAYHLAAETAVMLAPVEVLHLPPPDELAIEALGEARARELLAEGGSAPVAELVAAVAAAPAVTPRAAV